MKLSFHSRLAGLIAVAGVAVTACASTPTATTAGTGSPSMPAMAMTSDAGSGMTTTGMMTTASSMTADFNAADVMFAQMMIIHHQGAIAMAQLVPDRAGSQEVKDLAAQIEAAQGPEIEQMAGWLTQWGAPMTAGTDMSTPDSMTSSGGMGGTDESGAADMSMPGMMTEDQMTELEAATGADFDRLFLELMITHHEGAVAMADTELAEGSNADALALASSIKTSQTAEIATMQRLLAAM